MTYAQQIEALREYYKVPGALISRTFDDEVCVRLTDQEAEYKARFFTVERSDSDLVETAKLMRQQGLKSSF